jgi:hypothetical protein
MQRLISLIEKNRQPLTTEQLQVLSAKVRTIHLLPGECLPGDIQDESYVFVEQGFLMMTQLIDDSRRCSYFYPEESMTLFKNGAPIDLHEDGFRVEATEPSVVCCISLKDEFTLYEVIPSLGFVLQGLLAMGIDTKIKLCNIFIIKAAERTLGTWSL